MIGQRKYDYLKNLATELSDTDRKLMTEFEESRKVELTEKNKKYFKNMKRSVLKGDYHVDYDKLLNAFKSRFRELKSTKFDESRLNNVDCILKYFANDKEFLKNDLHCKNKKGGFISQPSFNKGLLIVGDYGCGKSSTMQVLKSLFDNTPLTFKSYTTNRIVTSFESFSDNSDRTAYINRTTTKDAYFDDVKTEKDASNYGVHNLMKSILEERSISDHGFKTYMTCNFVEGDRNKDVESALYEFNTRYGERVFDRLFEMCNIIEFKGGSMRK